MIDGILNVYKERGWTSHDVVAKLRTVLHQKKIGHTGTLDPEAEGVLPVCLGKATKVCGLLTDHSKTYRAVLLLGVTTDTQDLAGTVLGRKPVLSTEAEVSACISGFIGTQEQLPPMYSALRVNGRRLYELARQGIEMERRPRTITVEQIRLERMELPEVEFTVSCSKGTYIRTLCHDIGQRLGCGGAMKSLLRTRVGPFGVKDSLTIEELVRLQAEGRVPEAVLPVDSVFSYLPYIRLDGSAERLVRNGNPLPQEMADALLLWQEAADTSVIPLKRADAMAGSRQETAGAAGQYRVYGTAGDFLAVYGWDEAKRSYRAVKMFL